MNGRRLVVSNLDKILFPGYKFTKADVIDYYIRISKYLLPHFRNRPVTLNRKVECPDLKFSAACSAFSASLR